MTCSLPAASARRAASITPLIACVGSGAGRMPSALANWIPAAKQSSWP